MNSTLDYKPAGFFRRMVALFYDLILIIALCVGLTLLITYALNTEVESPLMYLVFLALGCLLYTSPSPRDSRKSRMPSSA